MKEMEKSLEAAWDAIGDIQEESKASCASRKKLQTDLDSQSAEIIQLNRRQSQLDDQRQEIEDLKTKLAEEQEKVIALETYSRRENLLKSLLLVNIRDLFCLAAKYNTNRNSEHRSLRVTQFTVIYSRESVHLVSL